MVIAAGWNDAANGLEQWRPAAEPDQVWWVSPSTMYAGWVLQLLTVEHGETLRTLRAGTLAEAKGYADQIDAERG